MQKTNLASMAIGTVVLSVLVLTGVVAVAGLALPHPILEEPEAAEANFPMEEGPGAVDSTPKIAAAKLAPVELGVPRDEAESEAVDRVGLSQAELRSAYRVQLAVDGLLSGRIQTVDTETGVLWPASDAAVYFVRDGRVVSYVKPDVHGVFLGAGLRPGRHSVFAAGAVGFLSFAIDIVAPSPADKDAVAQIGMRIDAVLVPPVDIPMVQRLAVTHLPAAGVNHLVGPELEQPVVAPAPGVPGINPLLLKEGEVLGHAEASIKQPVLHLDVDGDTEGRIVKLDEVGWVAPAWDSQVFFITHGALRGRAQVNDQGVFQIRGLQPGYYSVVVVGPEGFAAVGVQVADVAVGVQGPGVPRDLGSASLLPVSFLQVEESQGEAGDSEAVDMEMAITDEFDVIRSLLGVGPQAPDLPPSPFDPLAPDDCCCGTDADACAQFAAGAGGWGGGGLGGGGGLLGALLGGTAGGVIGALLAGGDGGGHSAAASPFLPAGIQ